MTSPTGRVPKNLYQVTEIIKTDEYLPFTKKLVVCGITLMGREDVSNDFMKKVAITIRAMFPRNGVIKSGLQEAVIKNMYRYRAVIPLFKGEVENKDQVFTPKERRLWEILSSNNSICDIIMEGVSGQVNEVVEHILHYVTDIGLHYTFPAE